jgi:hypothetical protein
MCWTRTWFYLPNMVLVLPSFLEERPGGAALASGWLLPLAEENTKVLALMGAIEALKAQGLIGPVVVRTFIQRQILPLRERAHPRAVVSLPDTRPAYCHPPHRCLDQIRAFPHRRHSLVALQSHSPRRWSRHCERSERMPSGLLRTLRGRLRRSG